jgi:hypothetical protein
MGPLARRKALRRNDVGMLQCTMPLYQSEIAPTRLRGLFINPYDL